MVRSNEFSADSLALAAKKATAAYDRRARVDRKSVCSDLAFEFADAKREVGAVLDEVEDLRREAERLQETARSSAFVAGVSAAIAAAGAFGSAIRALRLLSRLRYRDLNRSDWISLIPFIGGGVLAGYEAFKAVSGWREASRLIRQAEQTEKRADRLGDELLSLAEQYRRAGCGRERGTS